MDRSYIEQNRDSTRRIRSLAERLSDEELLRPVGEHWTVAITLAHLAFWDRRVLFVLDQTERDGRLNAHVINLVVNDIDLPLWAAIPPRACCCAPGPDRDSVPARWRSLGRASVAPDPPFAPGPATAPPHPCQE